MQLPEVKALCDQLREVIAAGPGRNDLALQEAVGIVSMLQGAAPWNGPRDKLVTIRGWLTIWFSQRRWRQYGDEGEICRQSLLNDILVVESYWDRKTAVDYPRPAGAGNKSMTPQSQI
jgi:hypothetical protein